MTPRRCGTMIPAVQARRIPSLLSSSFITHHSSLRRAGIPVAALAAWCLCLVALAALPLTSRPASSQPPASQMSPRDFQAYYQTHLAELAPDDVDGLYALARMCANKDRPDLAAQLCHQILEIRPAYNRARVLLRASSQRMAAGSRPAPASRSAATRRAATASRPAPGPSARPQPDLTTLSVLSPEAINRIRLAEFRVDDMTDRPRLRLPRSVIQDFLEEADKAQAMTQLDKNRFNQPGNDDKLRYIINITGDRYFDRIQMTTEPRAMADFRRRAWPVIARGCATPTCHGGGDAGHLRFVLPVSYGPAMATNFYIASRFETATGKLVDREHPEASLLLQFGLSPEQAELRHPSAIAPAFNGPNDPRYLIVLDWIRQLRCPAPDYRITDRMWQRMPVRPTNPPAK
jgi:hypothetical protein